MNLGEELAWWRFYMPRQAVQLLARALPLAAIRDRLPRVVAERLRFGLYPARITDATEVECARSYAPWGEPARSMRRGRCATTRRRGRRSSSSPTTTWR